MTGGVPLDEARQAVTEVTAAAARLLRDLPDAATPAVGTWTVGDVAAHMAHVGDVDAKAVSETLDAVGVPLPRRVEDVAGLTDALLARDPLRDPTRHAAQLESSVADLLAACDDDREVPWLLDLRLPRSAVCGHLVSELLLHGWDAARAAGTAWTIAPEHARVAIEGFYVLAFPASEISARRRERRTGACEVRLRGGGRFVLAMTDDGPAVLPSGTPVDLHLSADPSVMLLAMSGRGGNRLVRLLRGDVAAWGRHPLRALRMLDGFRAP